MHKRQRIPQTLLDVFGLQGTRFWLKVNAMYCKECSDNHRYDEPCPVEQKRWQRVRTLIIQRKYNDDTLEHGRLLFAKYLVKAKVLKR